ncbi:MAG: hypothetical protein AAFN74_05395, partial [Myxococcota bacterium]
MATLIASSGCILPNDPLTLPTEESQPPRIELDSVSPKAAVTSIDVTQQACPPFFLAAWIRDPDSSRLLLRWVIRDVDDTRYSPSSAETINGSENTRQRVSKRIVIGEDFPDQFRQVDNPSGNHTATVTLY